MKAPRCLRAVGSRQCARPAGHAPGCSLIPTRDEVLAVVSRTEVEVPGIVVFRCRLIVDGLQCARPRRHGGYCAVIPSRDEVLRVLSGDAILVPRKDVL